MNKFDDRNSIEHALGASAINIHVVLYPLLRTLHRFGIPFLTMFFSSVRSLVRSHFVVPLPIHSLCVIDRIRNLHAIYPSPEHILSSQSFSTRHFLQPQFSNQNASFHCIFDLYKARCPASDREIPTNR